MGTQYLIALAVPAVPRLFKYCVPIIILLIFGLWFCREAAPAVTPGPDAELIVKFRGDANGVYAAESMGPDDRIKLVRAASPGQAAALRRELAADPGVEYVEKNQTARALFTPNDPYFLNGAQWNLKQVKAPAAWDIDPGAGDGVIVAVLDTGVAYEDYSDGKNDYRRMRDLSAATFVPGWDFINNDGHPNDDHGHGTHVAGVIAAATNDGYGAAGLAYGARIMPVKVLNRSGVGSAYNIARGIRWAADRGAKVINLSLGLERPSRTIKNAIYYARNVKGVTVVAAAGNSADPSEYPSYRGGLMFPARYSSVISVGSTRIGRKRAAYSQYGRALDIVAPGGDMRPGLDKNGDGFPDGIVQETIEQKYYGDLIDPSSSGLYWAEGTSVAAPHVAAAAAMVIAGGVTRPGGVYRALTRSAADLGRRGRDRKHGYGLLNVAAALRYRERP